ncbi:response regulator transcription factor [Micromonosporaceae bacterium Da 78-11]
MRDDRKPPAELITERQRRVLRLLCEGASDRQIAGRIDASERTVQREIGQIRSLFGAGSRIELVATAIRVGLDEPRPG